MDRHLYGAQETRFPFGSLQTSVQLPSPEGETFEHQLDGFCWCQPTVETDTDGGHIFIHRRTLDSPHIEVMA